MKILFVTRGITKRGGHILLTAVARELRQRGHEITVLTFKQVGEPAFSDCEVFWSDIQPLILEIPQVSHPELWNIEALKKEVDFLQTHERNFDRIILDGAIITWGGIKAGIISTKVFQLMQSEPEFTPEDYGKLWKAEVFSFVPRYPMKRIVVSHALARSLEKRYQQKAFVIEPFVDQIYHDADFQVRDRFPIRIISAAADFNIASKGLGILLDILENFTTYPFELTLVSGNPLRRDISGFKFPVRERTANNPQDMALLLREHEIFATTSMNEGFGLCLAEAMALGMPSVALDSIGNRDYVTKKNTIFIGQRKNLSWQRTQFRAALEKLQNRQARKAMSAEAKVSMRKYTLDRMVDQFFQIMING